MGDKHGFLGLMATRFPWFEVVCGKDGKMIIVVPLQIWHKLNYYYFSRIFENLFIICAEILIKSKFPLLGFKILDLHY
jgi:hypothetical protein